MKLRTKILLLVLVLAAASTGAWFLWGQPLTPALVTVRSAAVGRGEISVTAQATGKIEPNTITTLRPDPNLPSRQVVAVLVKNGDLVKAGQIVARIDPSGLDLDLASDRANLDAQKSKLATLQDAPLPQDLTQAQSNLTQAKLDAEAQTLTEQRNKTLADQGLITQQTWEDTQRAAREAEAKATAAQAAFDTVKGGTRPEDLSAQKAAVASAQSTLLKAQLILNSTTVRSPVDGIVSEVLVNVGDMAGANTALLTVSDINPMIVRGYADEIDATTIHPGQSAVVTLDSFPGMKILGTVTEVDYRSIVQSNVTNFTVLVKIPNPKGEFRWGMSATAEITTTDLKDVLTVPNAALRTSLGRTQVVVVDGDQPYLWDILTGATDGVNTQVLAGLDEGNVIWAAVPKASARPAATTAPGFSGANPANQLLRGLR